MLGAVVGFFGRMFTSPDSAKKSLEMITDGIDAAILTKEEKIQYSQKGVELYLQWFEAANTGSNISRRFIAIVITVIWALAVTGCFLFATLAIWVEAFSAVATIFFDMAMKLVLPSWGAVMLFYFGKGILEQKK